MNWSILEYAEFISKEPLEPSEEDIEAMKTMKLNRGQFLAFKFGKMKINGIIEEINLKVIAAAGKIKLLDSLKAHKMFSATPNPAVLSLQLLKLGTELGISHDVMADIQVNNIALLVRDRNIFEFINGKDENTERRKIRIELRITEDEVGGKPTTPPTQDEEIGVLYKGLVNFMSNVMIFTVDKQIDHYRYY